MIITIDTDKIKIGTEEAKKAAIIFIQVGEFMAANSNPMPVREVMTLPQISNLFLKEVGTAPTQWSDNTYLIHDWSDIQNFLANYKWTAGTVYPWTLEEKLAYRDCDKFAYHIAAMFCWIFQTNSMFKVSGVIDWPTRPADEPGNHAYNMFVARDANGNKRVYLYDGMYNYFQQFVSRKANRGNVTYNSTYSIITI
jgi:hypothetical protein